MQSMQKGPKACTTCAKAKARCIPRADGGEKCERYASCWSLNCFPFVLLSVLCGMRRLDFRPVLSALSARICLLFFLCQSFYPRVPLLSNALPLCHNRCHRLKKDCFSRPPAPPRIKKRPKRSRVAELEKRLNELSSQFEGTHPVASSRSVSAASPPQLATKAPEKADMYSFEHLFPSPSPTGDDGHEASAWSPEVMKEFDSPWPLPTESEMLLMVYREMFAEYFPFVLIPRELSSADLRLQRPFLWKAVMVSACIFDSTRQVKLGEELLADIGKASIVDGTRSLDMLQAVEMLIGW